MKNALEVAHACHKGHETVQIAPSLAVPNAFRDAAILNGRHFVFCCEKGVVESSGKHDLPVNETISGIISGTRRYNGFLEININACFRDERVTAIFFDPKAGVFFIRQNVDRRGLGFCAHRFGGELYINDR